MTLHYLIIFGILHGPYTHRPFRRAFYRPQSNYIRAIEPIHDITGHRSLVSRRSARTVTPVTITPPSMTPASCNFIVIRDKPASFLPDFASGHFISHPLRPRALREGGQWNSSLRISERHPTSPTPPSSLRPLSLSTIFLSCSILSRARVPSSRVHFSCRFLAFTLSLSLPPRSSSSAAIGCTSAAERGESGQIEMLYYLNSVATTVRDLLVDVAPDSPL